jgi:hypothetical protein
MLPKQPDHAKADRMVCDVYRAAVTADIGEVAELV